MLRIRKANSLAAGTAKAGTAVKAGRGQVGPIRALIAGGTSSDERSQHLEGELAAFVAANGLSQHVRFLGVRNDVHLIYSISDMAGLTSASEGLPLSLVEAAAMGLPLFGSDVGGIPEVVIDGENGCLFDVYDSKALAAMIVHMIDSQSTLEHFAKNSRKLAEEQYDMAANVGKLVGMYETLGGRNAEF